MRNHALALAALVLLNVLIKFTLWTEPPQTFTDSLSYIAPAISLLDGHGYGSQENAYRTPTYPLFIAAILLPFDHHDLASCPEPRVPACLGGIQSEPNADANLRAIISVQIILGTLIIPLIYFFALKVALNPWAAALCALTYPFDLSTGYWEISILTEALTTFLLMLAIVLTVLAAKATQHRVLVHTGLALTLAALALCQPIYLLYSGLVFVFVIAVEAKQHLHPPFGRAFGAVPVSPVSNSRLLRRFAPRNPGTARHPGPRSGAEREGRCDSWLVVLIPLVTILAWSARNFFVDGLFTPSTLSGYNLTQMVGPFMELAPEQYRDLAEIYVDTRKEREPIRGTHSGTIFFAYREMLTARQTTWAGLSRDLTNLSLQLIMKNPVGYLQVVAQSFDQFWKFGLGRQNPGVPASYAWVSWFFDSRVQQMLTVLFWLSPLGLLLARRSDRETVWIWFAIATVWYVALFSSALNFGDNERYRVPVARLQYSAIILTAWTLWKRSNVPMSER